MGSIVKTIGKVIKKVGKALKKIAPVLLVAAAAYVGYGYMTGFQSGGWPQITEWGKSLMGNVSSGMPISEAAMSADPSILADAAPQAQTFPYSGAGSVAGTPLDVTTTPPLETGLLGTQPSSVPVDLDTAANLSIDSMPEMAADASTFAPEMATDPAGMISAMGETGATVAEAGGLISGPRINPLFDSMASEYNSTGLVDSFSDYLVNQKQVSDNSFFMSQANAADTSFTGSTFDPALGSDSPINPVLWDSNVYPGLADVPTIPSSDLAYSDFPTGQMQGTYPGFSPNIGHVSRIDLASAADAASGGSGLGEASNTIMSWGGKAWGIFKAAVEKNPGMAMWSAVKIIETIATLLDDSEEQESYAARHVMGFAPGNYDDLSKKYGGMPTSTKSDFWKSVDAGNQGRLTASSKVKTGTKPMGNTRISAINRSPGGIIGNPKQVQA